ncbi:MAG: D-glycero-beta-D-manno-heptose 1-phosphate adenylyltransferase [Ginsengibacter sp.]|jgi:D-beta-D-heptose 7-phosphate kinase/D-beta-D-heptose 1-phosphate adenosyltransferase
MKKSDTLNQRIFTVEDIKQEVIRIRLKSKTIAFTNGVFDILHQGHIAVLSEAASFADVLIVGVNSDASVKKLKGEGRPVNNEYSRALIIASLIMVDAVVIFNEETPLELIKIIKPDVLIKGGDYTMETMVGSKEVLENGGRIEIIPIKEGFSTTGIIRRISGNE